MSKNLKISNFSIMGANSNSPSQNTDFKVSSDKLANHFENSSKDEKEIIKLIDYVSSTFTFNDIEKLVKLWKLCGYDKNEVHYNDSFRQGYKSYYELGENIKVLMSGPKNKEDKHVNQLEMRGMGCRDFEMRNIKNEDSYFKLFSFLDLYNANFTRIDITHDVFTDKYFTLEEIEEYIENGDYVSVLNDVKVDSGIKKGQKYKLIYFGTMSSDCSICFYDKNLERIMKKDYQAITSSVHLRIEIRLRRDRANQFIQTFLEDKENVGQVISEYLYYLLDFKDPDDTDLNKSRRQTVSWWKDFLQVGEKKKLKSLIKSSSLSVKKEWLRTSVARVLMLYYLGEEDFFYNYLHILMIEAFTHFNEKDLVIVNEYRDKYAKKRITMEEAKRMMELLDYGNNKL